MGREQGYRKSVFGRNFSNASGTCKIVSRVEFSSMMIEITVFVRYSARVGHMTKHIWRVQ